MSSLIIIRWRFTLLAVAILAGQGCSTQAPRVDCDERLTPINAPAPKRGMSAAGAADASGASENSR